MTLDRLEFILKGIACMAITCGLITAISALLDLEHWLPGAIAGTVTCGVLFFSNPERCK
jgi:hypothetical protein